MKTRTIASILLSFSIQSSATVHEPIRTSMSTPTQKSWKISHALPKQAEGIAQVHVQSWKETYSGMVPQGYIEEESFEKRLSFWKKYLSANLHKRVVYVVLDDQDAVVGFSSAGATFDEFKHDPSKYDSELYAMYLLKAYQKQGIGKELFFKTMSELKHFGFHSMILWVQEGNPTCAFYEYMGGKRLGERVEDWNGTKIKDLAYGWKDL